MKVDGGQLHQAFECVLEERRGVTRVIGDTIIEEKYQWQTLS